MAFKDDKTGLAVDPPAPFVATLAQSRNNDVTVAVDSTTGRPAPAGASPHLCLIAFKAEAANAAYTQAALNALVDDKAWREQARAKLQMIFAIDEETTFNLVGARGVEYRVTPVFGPQADRAHVVLSILETPRGRISQSCALAKSDSAAALPQVRAIRSSITPPR